MDIEAQLGVSGMGRRGSSGGGGGGGNSSSVQRGERYAKERDLRPRRRETADEKFESAQQRSRKAKNPANSSKPWVQQKIEPLRDEAGNVVKVFTYGSLLRLPSSLLLTRGRQRREAECGGKRHPGDGRKVAAAARGALGFAGRAERVCGLLRGLALENKSQPLRGARALRSEKFCSL